MYVGQEEGNGRVGSGHPWPELTLGTLGGRWILQASSFVRNGAEPWGGGIRLGAQAPLELSQPGYHLHQGTATRVPMRVAGLPGAPGEGATSERARASSYLSRGAPSGGARPGNCLRGDMWHSCCDLRPSATTATKRKLSPWALPAHDAGCSHSAGPLPGLGRQRLSVSLLNTSPDQMYPVVLKGAATSDWYQGPVVRAEWATVHPKQWGKQQRHKQATLSPPKFMASNVSLH